MKWHYLAAVALLPLSCLAQSLTFETQDYKRLDVYDTWEKSPFRTGELAGRSLVVDNPDKEIDETLGQAPNPSTRVLAVQRSRYGSNTFGARIDLQQPFELTTTTKYVHVLLRKPKAGRVMLIGLGKRPERAAQSAETEQFWVQSSSAVVPDVWCDAVFPIKGAGGIDIHSLVVVPDMESPHDLSEDFIAYIDEIEINDSPETRTQREDYPTNFDKKQAYTRTDRHFNGASFSCLSGGSQRFSAASTTTVYTDLTGTQLQAKAGETVSTAFDYTGNWMHGYVYLDRANDGKFTFAVEADGRPSAESDLMAYSFANSKNSAGEAVSSSGPNVLNPPTFVVPALAPGFYRLRYKVDWDHLDAGGRVDASNSIIQNGGGIIDVLLNVHTDQVSVSDNQLNGEVLAGDGSKLNNYQTAFGQSFVIRMNPEKGFTYNGVTIRHGYHLTGDSVLHGNRRWREVFIPAFAFKNDTLRVPAELVDGDLLISAGFIEQKADTTAQTGVDYPLHFSSDLLNSHASRRLSRLTFIATTGGTTTLSIPTAAPVSVYQSLLGKQVSAVPGDVIRNVVSYAGNGMHTYLYIDYNQDGRFSADLDAEGRPTVTGELVSYSCYNGKNSLGETVTEGNSLSAVPNFTLPVYLPTGVYRARYKIDHNNIDPGGQWTAAGTDNIDANGGYVVDFLLNVHHTPSLTVHTTDGSLSGANYTGLPTVPSLFRQLVVVPQPATSDYSASELTVKHGLNFDGPQYVHGNRQWSEYTVDITGKRQVIIPADSIDGDIVLTCHFSAGVDPVYTKVFEDEFDAPDGSQPDASKWRRSERRNAAWNRFVSNSDDVVYIRDGQLVTRCIPNPDPSTDPVEMLSGAVETRGLFSFRYGKIEARLRTYKHTGSFPAFWMMPADQTGGWPVCGEIDIWETINTEDRAYHTVHSHWTYNLKQTGNPTSGGNEVVANDRYHTYGLEWDSQSLKWFVDGKQVFTYNKSTDASALAQGQWPFDKEFYIILNQSVGNGSWAARPDVAHTYETDFDWVRVYTRSDSSVTGLDGAPTTALADDAYYDLSGRRVLRPQRGVYIRGGKKVML